MPSKSHILLLAAGITGVAGRSQLLQNAHVPPTAALHQTHNGATVSPRTCHASPTVVGTAVARLPYGEITAQPQLGRGYRRMPAEERCVRPLPHLHVDDGYAVMIGKGRKERPVKIGMRATQAVRFYVLHWRHLALPHEYHAFSPVAG